jgi:dTDP-4-dehydrorhamnose 3,5-epimerase
VGPRSVVGSRGDPAHWVFPIPPLPAGVSHEHRKGFSALDLSASAAESLSYQDYGPQGTIDGVEFLDLRRFTDDGGSFTELGRFFDGGRSTGPAFQLAQVNYSIIEPGVIRAYHLHPNQTDLWFVPPEDRLLMVLADVRRGSKTEGVVMRFVAGYGKSRLIAIPPGVAHGAKNLSPSTGRIFYFVDRYFTAGAECEEGRLPWDHFGAGVWEMVRG